MKQPNPTRLPKNIPQLKNQSIKVQMASQQRKLCNHRQKNRLERKTNKAAMPPI